MSFAIGDINIEVIGKSFIVGKLNGIMECIRTEASSVDLIFKFVDELPDWGSQAYVSLDNYDVGHNRFRVKEKLFCYEFCPNRYPVTVLVAARKTDIGRTVQRAITKSWRYMHTHGSRAYLHYLKRFLFYIYMPLVELMLLKKDSSFSHCSAIERQGQAVLFPAWGGVGKTSIMGRYIEEGWNFLSDDSCVISASGTASIHPLPMHIYKYHETQGGQLVKKMLSQFTVSDRLLWRFLSKFKKQDKLVRWVGADTVFGKEKISTNGKISAVIHMHRQMQSNTFELQKATPLEVAKLMASTLLDEINNLANISIVAHSCKPIDFIPDISNLHKHIIDIYSNAFVSANCYTLIIPQRGTAEDTYSFLEKKKLF